MQIPSGVGRVEEGVPPAAMELTSWAVEFGGGQVAVVLTQVQTLTLYADSGELLADDVVTTWIRSYGGAPVALSPYGHPIFGRTPTTPGWGGELTLGGRLLITCANALVFDGVIDTEPHWYVSAAQELEKCGGLVMVSGPITDIAELPDALADGLALAVRIPLQLVQ